MQERQLKSIAIIIMGTSPKGDTYNNDGLGLPLLNGPTEFGPTHPSCTLFTTDSKRSCKRGDLIFCVRGSTTGRMNWGDQTYSLGRGVCAIRGETFLDTKFIKYFLDCKLKSLLMLAGGSTFPNLTQETISTFPIPYPPYRHKISLILSAYDDLIENNLRRIKILGEMAQTLYREWFVKFRFPGHHKVKMVDSPSGKIPEGWEVLNVENIVKRNSPGKLYEQKTVYAEGTVPVLDQGRSGVIGYHDDSPGVEANKENPVIIFANHTCYQRIIHFPFSAIQNVIPFYPNPDHYRNIYWLHYATKDLISFNDYKGHWPEYMGKKVVVPTTQVAEDFGSYIKLNILLVFKLQNKCKNLSKTRDLLLPKLISGELDVSELDITIPEANA